MSTTSTSTPGVTFDSSSEDEESQQQIHAGIIASMSMAPLQLKSKNKRSIGTADGSDESTPAPANKCPMLIINQKRVEKTIARLVEQVVLNDGDDVVMKIGDVSECESDEEESDDEESDDDDDVTLDKSSSDDDHDDDNLLTAATIQAAKELANLAVSMQKAQIQPPTLTPNTNRTPAQLAALASTHGVLCSAETKLHSDHLALSLKLILALCGKVTKNGELYLSVKRLLEGEEACSETTAFLSVGAPRGYQCLQRYNGRSIFCEGTNWMTAHDALVNLLILHAVLNGTGARVGFGFKLRNVKRVSIVDELERHHQFKPLDKLLAEGDLPEGCHMTTENTGLPGTKYDSTTSLNSCNQEYARALLNRDGVVHDTNGNVRSVHSVPSFKFNAIPRELLNIILMEGTDEWQPEVLDSLRVLTRMKYYNAQRTHCSVTTGSRKSGIDTPSVKQLHPKLIRFLQELIRYFGFEGKVINVKVMLHDGEVMWVPVKNETKDKILAQKSSTSIKEHHLMSKEEFHKMDLNEMNAIMEKEAVEREKEKVAKAAKAVEREKKKVEREKEKVAKVEREKEKVAKVEREKEKARKNRISMTKLAEEVAGKEKTNCLRWAQEEKVAKLLCQKLRKELLEKGGKLKKQAALTRAQKHEQKLIEHQQKTEAVVAARTALKQ